MIQRKIYNLLTSEGQGKTFRYHLEMYPPFDLSLPLTVTEKVDGSTMQAYRGKPWKRFDRFKKGSKRKRSVLPAERYELRLLEDTEPAHKWLLASFTTYRSEIEIFGKHNPGLWLYFEALGAKIQARYRDLPPTIRMFDMGNETEFLHFFQTKQAAETYDLPLVASHKTKFSSLEEILTALEHAASNDPRLPDHELEGWVLRQNINGKEIVAKIRKSDLKKIA